MDLFRTKPVTADPDILHRYFTAFDLTLLGIGAIIGAGVFVLTGIAAATKAGPAVVFSYFIAGLASLFAALSYAELASSVGGTGSAYNYTYIGFGELIAWIIGWNLIFEYALSVAAVAIGWSGYVNDALISFHLYLPNFFLKNPFEGGMINLPAVLIILLLGTLLCLGIRQSARFNFIMVMIKLITILLFVSVAIHHVNLENWQDFLPFGWHGVMQGSALVFFAYIGFDALATATEETINPQRNIPIGITCSVLICSAIYILVSGLLTLMTPYTLLNVKSPVSYALLSIGFPTIAGVVAVGAIAGLTTVMLVMYYGLTRITLAIARDGLLPIQFAAVHPQTKTPVSLIIFYGCIIAVIAGFMPLNDAAELVNIGTLSAFTLVCAGVAVIRLRNPDLPRPFKLPLHPFIPVMGIIFCLYLMLHLSVITWIRFIIWIFLGFIIYFGYSYWHSLLQKKKIV